MQTDKKAVIDEINEQWGNKVLIYGPILKIPYKVFKDKTVTDKNTKHVYTETIEEIKFAYFLPGKFKHCYIY